MPSKYSPLPYAEEIDSFNPCTGRIQRLRERSLNEPIHICAHRSRIATASWRETDGQPLHIRRARLFEKLCDEMPLKIFDAELIVGSQTPYLRGVGLQLDYNPKPGFELMAGDRRMRAEQSTGSLSEEDLAQISADTQYWGGRSPGEQMLEAIHERYGEAYDDAIYCCARSYASFTNYAAQADYGKVLEKGMRGIVEEIDRQLADLDFVQEGSGQKRTKANIPKGHADLL